MNDDISREKPYDFVPLANGVKNEKASGHHTMIGLQKEGLLSGSLSGKIVSESLIHVSSGFVVPVEGILQYDDVNLKSVDNDQLVMSHTRTKGARVIPGSTIKGVIRSAVEAITATGTIFETRVKKKRVRGWDVEEIKIHAGHQDLAVPPVLPHISLASRLFGLISKRYGYQGHCTFFDALQQKGEGVVFRRLPLYRPQPDYSEGNPRLETSWHRYFLDPSRKIVRGRKFYRSGVSEEVDEPYNAVEGCSIGSEFDFRVQFSNLKPEELGVMLIVIGADNDILRLKMGSGKPLSLGSVHFRDLSLKILNQSSYTSFDSEYEDYPIASCVEAANNSDEIFSEGRKKLAEITSRPTSSVIGQESRSY